EPELHRAARRAREPFAHALPRRSLVLAGTAGSPARSRRARARDCGTCRRPARSSVARADGRPGAVSADPLAEADRGSGRYRLRLDDAPRAQTAEPYAFLTDHGARRGCDPQLGWAGSGRHAAELRAFVATAAIRRALRG